MNEGCAMTRVWRGYASLKMLQQSSTNILLVGAWVAPPSRLSFSDEIPALSMQQPLEVASFPAGIHFMLTSTCRANITARYCTTRARHVQSQEASPHCEWCCWIPLYLQFGTRRKLTPRTPTTLVSTGFLRCSSEILCPPLPPRSLLPIDR